ncbi:MAG TPA: SMC-Scp complex subunit ScpB, partial [Gemmataceae bacterium]|nr:SMC-Scp complex subunit ScpB [Gemmataceae bacterium]
MRGRALVGFQVRSQRAGLPRDRHLPMVYRVLAGERGDPVVKGELARDRDLANVEAALFIADEPLSARRLAQAAGLNDGAAARRLVRKLQTLYDKDGTAFQVE